LIKLSKRRIEEIVNGFKGKRILVAGDLMLDEYLIGEVRRISPEAPVPVVEVKEQQIRFGGAANVALNVVTLGAEPVLVGAIGTDREGDLFTDLMREKRMPVEGLQRFDNRPTTVKTRVIGHSQHITRVDREKKDYLTDHEEKQIINIIEKLIDQVDAVILEDYNKGVLTARVIEASIGLARKKNKLTTVDPKFTNFLNYKNVSVFKPNIKETEEALAVHLSSEEDLNNAGRNLLKKLNAENILITRGSAGMSLFESSGEITHVGTTARKVADVSGAGDTVISTLTVALVGGAGVREAATMANLAAGIVCQEVGIVPVELNQLYRACLEDAAQ
jgi:rfaE bifunctional protein kinase chain/domain